MSIIFVWYRLRELLFQIRVSTKLHVVTVSVVRIDLARDDWLKI